MNKDNKCKNLKNSFEDKDALANKNSKFSEEELTDVTKIDINEDTLKMKISSVQAAPASLVLLVGPQNLVGFSWSLSQPIVTVGRSSRLADMIIKSDNLSKSHFQIIQKETDIYVMDLNSTNKTHKNNQVLQPYKEYELLDNDRIKAGNLIFKFLEEGSIENLSSQHLLDKAYTDSLTEIGNRQYLETKGKSLFNHYQDLCLIVFDVDKFKYINDNYGHLSGDYVLKTLTKVVLNVIRDEDTFFRYGGDEFCIFTPFPLNVGQSIAKRIIKQVQDHEFNFENKQIDVSISVGVSDKKIEDEKWENVYKRADEHCYKNKNSVKTDEL